MLAFSSLFEVPIPMKKNVKNGCASEVMMLIAQYVLTQGDGGMKREDQREVSWLE